jgi:signal transduction histidine kinase/ActR/RegA family two-component response regulator
LKHREEVFQKLGNQTCEIRLKRKYGAAFYAQLESIAKENDNGKAGDILTTIVDVTESKKAEEKIEHLASVPELNPNPVIETDLKGQVIFYNAATMRILKNLNAPEDIRLFLPPDLAEMIKKLEQGDEGQYVSHEVEINGRVFTESIIYYDYLKLVRLYAQDITERNRIEDAQLFQIKRSSTPSGEDFFISLARYLGETLEMDYVCIDRLLNDNLSAQTVAVYFDGKYEDNVTYTLKDTPCGDVVGKTICSFPRDVRHLFPRDAALQEMMAESYVGTTLWSSRGQPIGLIAVIGRQPRADLHLAEAILKVVAIRAAGELERRQALAETQRLASFPMLNPRPIVEVDVAGHVHFCNPTAMQMFPDLCERGQGHPWLADWESALHSLREAGVESIVREVPVSGKWYHQTIHLVEDAQRVRIYGADITARKQAEEALLKANAELEQKVSDRTSELAVKIDELKLANEGLESRTKQLGLLAAELTLTEQRERKRLSQLLHDGLQQHLLSANMRLGGVAELTLDVDLKQAIDEIQIIISESVQLSRSLSAALSPPILHECGLSGGLEWLVRWMRDKHSFKVDLSIETQPELPEDVKILVFESVRELLVNAVKHSKVCSARVSLNQVNGAGLRIVVSDEGTGFDPCQLKPPGEEGGFGLFSVRERIGLIGGSIEIDSAPGKGSRLVLLVPHGQASAVPFSTDRICTLAAEPREDTVKDQGTTIRVLLADDHALFRNGLCRLLKNELGLEVVGQANDGKEAINLAQQLKPDVILMDISMPRVNGIEATRIIHPEHPDIRIIGLSMYEDQERAQAMRDAGASDYKSKECEAVELVSAIRGCVLQQ